MCLINVVAWNMNQKSIIHRGFHAIGSPLNTEFFSMRDTDL